MARRLVVTLLAVVWAGVLHAAQLAGLFNVEREWAPDPLDSLAPSLVTALREQLGLKREPTRAPIEVLVVDRATHRRRTERPPAGS